MLNYLAFLYKLPMKQKSDMWYGSRKEPNVQINIMREIGINGKQTRADLSRSLKPISYATIDSTLSRNDETDDFLKLFWCSGTINQKGKVQKQYSLTGFGINCLLRDHYKVSGKPYLNLKEYSKFISIYEKEHSVLEFGEKIPFDIYSHIYFEFNPSMINQVISNFKNNTKLEKLSTSIKSTESKIKLLEKEKITKELELKKLLMNLMTPSKK